MIKAKLPDGTTLAFPDDTSDEVIDRVVKGHMTQAPQRGLGEGLLRQAGLTARNMAQGAMALPGMVGDAANAAINLPIRGINAATGSNIPTLGSASQSIQAGIAATGLPQPENATERVVGRVVQDVTGAMTPAVLAKVAAPIIREAPATVRAVIDAFAARPGLQMSGAVGSGLGAGTAREIAPDSPTAEIFGSLGGGAAGMAAHGATQGAAAIARALAEPFTEPGRERIVGDTISRMAQNPRALAEALARNPQEFVPGSLRTTAEVAGDAGLMQGERAIRSMDPRSSAEFALRDASRNSARSNAIEGIAPGGGINLQEGGDILRNRLVAALRGVKRQVGNMYQQIDPENTATFSGQQIYGRAAPVVAEMYGHSTGGTPTELLPILDRMRASERLGFSDMQALDRELGDIAGRARSTGDATLANTAGRMRSAVTGALDDGANGQLSGFNRQQQGAYREAKRARSAVGAAYEEGAVGRAMDANQFGRHTMPPERVPETVMGGPTAINQLNAAVLHDPQARQAAQRSFVTIMQRDIANATPDAVGNATDSAAKFHRFLAKNREVIDTLFGGRQAEMLNAVARDFTSRQMVDNVGRAIGSNTIQNLSTANVIAAISGGIVDPARMGATPLTRTMQWLYGLGPETIIRETLTEAMLNPALAQRLVGRATPQNLAATAALLERGLMARIGNAANQFGGATVPTTANAIAQPQQTQ